MYPLDIISIIFSFVGALFVCCMLSILARRGASLKPYNPKRSPLSTPPPARTHSPQTRPSLTHLPRTRFSTAPLKAPNATISPQPYFGYLTTRPHTTMSMFKQAVQDFDSVASSSPPNTAFKQASLGNTFKARPLGNGLKQNNAGVKRSLGAGTQGTKRTSNGFAKFLGSGPEEDGFDYPTLNIAGMEKENELPTAFHANTTSSLASALFDEDDFDSDVDLDVEDPATKGTVTYPTLPSGSSTASRDSGYDSRAQTADMKPESKSSQPIPWSSSPPEHFQAPTKSEPLKTKRRKLPWTLEQKTQSIQEDEAEAERQAARPSKRPSTEAEKVVSTPKPKVEYLWNTTASAIKQQQKNLREANKVQAKINQGTQDDVKGAVKKKKEVVQKIFLSEEQQNVVNLVVDNKKSVFFTGSAGTGKSVLLREIIAALRRKYVREPDRVAVTASTGLAACNIGGVTLHSFSGIGLVFAGMLNEMREGRLTPESIARFRKLERPLPVSEDSVEATELFPTRQEVDRSNTTRMLQLHGKTFTFEARDGGTITNKEMRDKLLQSCMVPEQIHLKKGAQVMLVKNMDETLVNGSLGKITGFMTEQMFNMYKDDEAGFLDGGPSEDAMKVEMAKSALGLNTNMVFPVFYSSLSSAEQIESNKARNSGGRNSLAKMLAR
ncbi:hypothetical protein GMOD_00000864 [Pyrenophora seminiperda CCB06]|uniref:ATP-dependent DNA helicase n=1 Tax=Pyrenophora seminiperda CCB06 TaxID=1302712 RepID=A0A3M7M891_9PLEO|nr:hypothetical protein GMOD_00000864 [Pyrenophora seminiperda CCB06]